MEKSLIAAVFKHKAIWDPSDKLRKNSKILSRLWEKVANEVGVDVKVARAKWKNLRAYFVAEHCKINKPLSGSHGSVKLTSTWAHFNQLMFLRDTLDTNDERRDSIGIEDADCSQKMSVEPLIADEIFHGLETNSPPTAEKSGTKITLQNTTAQTDKEDGPTDKDFTQSSNSNFLLRRSNTNKRKLGTTRRYTASKRASEFFVVKKRKVELLEKEINTDNDPDLYFFKSLLPFMAHFNPAEKLRIRSKIQEVILAEYERKEATANYCRASSETYPSSFVRSSYNPSPVSHLSNECSSNSHVEGQVN